MKIVLENLYHIKDGQKAYYRKQGIYCFDFVWDIQYATELTADEASKLMEHSEYYKQQYGADTVYTI